MRLTLQGRFLTRIRDARGWLLWEDAVDNAATVEGMNHLLGVGFNAVAQNAQWYAGLISPTGYTAVDDDDTLAAHAGWTELASYAEAARRQLTVQDIANAVLLTGTGTFTFAAETDVKGFFLASDPTKSGTTGVLWNTALFSVTRTVPAGGTIGVAYLLRATGGNL